MKKVPFNLDLFNKLGGIGKCQVVTRDDNPVRILCTDRLSENYPIIALLQNREFNTYTKDGCLAFLSNKTHLFILAPVEERIRPWKPEEGLGKWVKFKEDGKIRLLIGLNPHSLFLESAGVDYAPSDLLDHADEYDIATHKVIGPCGVKEEVV